MRELSDAFLACLKSGFLANLTEYVRRDNDLNLEIRDSYINIYYKGNSLLNLKETGFPSQYKTVIDTKFLTGIQVPPVLTESTTPLFIKNIPLLKENIIRYAEKSLEVEYEQLIIRANNFEYNNNTEYFIVDRQYVVPEGRFDLSGIHWKRKGRRKNQEVAVCYMEIKFALNNDIREVHNQLARYYEPIRKNASALAEEMQTVFRQKLELGLYNQPNERLEAMKTLRFSQDIDKFQFILVLVDYNPHSKLFALQQINELPFANQIKIFHAGFGMWSQNLTSVQASKKSHS
jgi:hypothetical protein